MKNNNSIKIEILQLKHMIFKMKIFIGDLNNRKNTGEEKTSELKNK